MRKIRIAFLNTHPIQYFAPLYAFLNRSGALSVTALYLSDCSIRGTQDRAFQQPVKWDISLLDGYDAQFVAGADRRGEPSGFFSMLAPDVWHEVRAGGFDALVVHGHSPAAMLVGLAAAKASSIPVFMRGETHLGLRRSGLKRALRRPALGALYRSFDGVLAIGSANAAYYRMMGVPEERIFLTPYSVDNDRFTATSRLTSAERAAVRHEMGVGDDRPLILFAGKFQKRKRPDDLMQAVKRLSLDGMKFGVVMVGSGEMASELRTMAKDINGPSVHFHGFANQSALPSIYGACDVFVLPSVDEPWGLAINEAMCAGLPIVASVEIGCVPDLVHDGVNGRAFPGGDIEALADALRELVLDRDLRRRMGAASLKMISRWGYLECQQGLLAALSSVGLSPDDSRV